jgi:hypothetical protein
MQQSQPSPHRASNPTSIGSRASLVGEFGDGNGPVIGRIMLHPQAPEAQPWFWTITSMEYPPSVYNKGYSATREQAMADFKARWLA